MKNNNMKTCPYFYYCSYHTMNCLNNNKNCILMDFIKDIIGEKNVNRYEENIEE